MERNPITPVLLIAGLVVSLGANSATTYRITDLGDLAGGSDSSYAGSVNNAGQVVGYSNAVTGWRAFLWTSGSGIQDLGDLPGGLDFSAAEDINDAGQVVGDSNAGDYRAFIWNSHDGMQELATVAGVSNFRAAYSINNAGQVAGIRRDDIGYHAVLWGASEGMQDLGDLPGGGVSSHAYGINDVAQVVGESRSAAGDRAFLWSVETGMQDLGILPTAATAYSFAWSINNSGLVVGESTGHAFLWSASEGMQDLGEGRAYGINNHNQVVGTTWDANGRSNAFLWENGKMTDLNLLVNAADPLKADFSLRGTTAINDMGQIVGWGNNGHGGEHAFLLTPVPEPGTYGMMLVGLGLVGWAARRRKLNA